MNREDAAVIRNTLIPLTWDNADPKKVAAILQEVWNRLNNIVARDEAAEEKRRQHLLDMNKSLKVSCDRLEEYLKS